jgi:hypothetical protein
MEQIAGKFHSYLVEIVITTCLLVVVHICATLQLHDQIKLLLVIIGDLLIIPVTLLIAFYMHIRHTKNQKIAILTSITILALISRALVLAAFIWKYTEILNEDKELNDAVILVIFANLLIQVVEIITILLVGIYKICYVKDPTSDEE